MKQRFNNVSWSNVLAFLIFVVIIFSDNFESDNALKKRGYSTITHEWYGFSIDYPTKWQAVTYNMEGKKSYDDSVKMELYIARRNPFGIYIRYRSIRNATLQDVSNWGRVITSRSIRREGIVEYQDMINDHPVIRQRYNSGSYVAESVYIARSDDMIIITMRVKQSDYDANIDDFNAVVASFRPFE